MEGSFSIFAFVITQDANLDSQYIFIIYGVVTVAMGIVTLALLPDTPANAWFLKAEEKVIAVQRVANNQTGVVRSKVSVRAFLFILNL